MTVLHSREEKLAGALAATSCGMIRLLAKRRLRSISAPITRDLFEVHLEQVKAEGLTMSAAIESPTYRRRQRKAYLHIQSGELHLAERDPEVMPLIAKFRSLFDLMLTTEPQVPSEPRGTWRSKKDRFEAELAALMEPTDETVWFELSKQLHPHIRGSIARDYGPGDGGTLILDYLWMLAQGDLRFSDEAFISGLRIGKTTLETVLGWADLVISGKNAEFEQRVLHAIGVSLRSKFPHFYMSHPYAKETRIQSLDRQVEPGGGLSILESQVDPRASAQFDVVGIRRDLEVALNVLPKAEKRALKIAIRSAESRRTFKEVCEEAGVSYQAGRKALERARARIQ